MTRPMIRSTLAPCRAALAGSGLLLLAACAPGGAAPTPAAAAAQNANHSTAASGFELGPENFNSNGGAFGPDQASP